MKALLDKIIKHFTSAAMTIDVWNYHFDNSILFQGLERTKYEVDKDKKSRQKHDFKYMKKCYKADDEAKIHNSSRNAKEWKSTDNLKAFTYNH